jgi:DNA-binding XRE family transcriptional regulator
MRCERCGAIARESEIWEEEDEINKHWGICLSMGTCEFDLCPDCTAKVVEWVYGKFTRQAIDQLKALRGSRSLRDVAKEVGVSAATLSRVENGKQPSLDSFNKIGEWLAERWTENQS